jgi:hypothetical protein
MPPAHLRFGGGLADTAISPLVLLWLLIAIYLIWARPRNRAIAPFLLAFFTIPMGQVLVIGGFHFTALRILILASLGRTLRPNNGNEKRFPGGFNGVDKMVVLWSILAVVALYLQFPQTQALVNGFGILIDTLGGYMVVRYLLPDRRALEETIGALALLSAILGICMICEQLTHINVFGLLEGGSGAATVRDGHVRAGATLGPLFAGAFAGVLIPEFLWLWSTRRSRLKAGIGLAGATAMVITSYSSTSWMALMGSLLGLAFWPLRKKMRWVRWGLVTSLVGLQLVMKAPVWALISRVDLTGSSSSYQRYMLVNMTILNFGKWWMIGTPSYVNWGWDSWDLCNQFVAVALTGGLLTLIFYIAIFKRSFGAIGNARKRVAGDRQQEWLLWCMGSALFATVVAHFGINYAAQLIMGFFVLIACILVATRESRRATDTPSSRTAPTTKRPASTVEPVFACQITPQAEISAVAERGHWNQRNGLF